MKILVLSQYFWPEQFIINEVAELLKKNKNEIDIFTGKPNYPDGKFYSGFNFFNKTFDKYKNFDLLRCPVIPRYRASNLLLILNYFSFVLFGTIFIFFLIFKRYDYIFVYQTSPVTSAIPAILLSRLKKIPLIIWVQDLWPETIQGTSHIKSKNIYKFIGSISKKIYNSADIIFTQSKSMKDYLKKKLNKKKNIFYLPNLIQKIIKPNNSSTFRKKLGLDKTINIMFAGNLGDAQNLKLIINIAKKFKNKNLKFLIVGTGSKFNYLKKLKKKNKLDNIILFGHKKLKQMPLYFSLADFMLITLKNKKVFSITVPNKLIAYMAASKPIISFVNGEASSIVKEAKCGYYINNYTLKSINNILNKVLKLKKSSLKNFSTNAKNYYKKNYNHKIFYKRFLSGIKTYENSKTNLF